MIKVENVVKSYGKVRALKGVSLEVKDGECFALLGLNGAGKTTLLSILSTSLNMDSGRVTMNDLDLATEKEKVRKIINISPQETAVAKNLTIKENFELISDLYKIANKEEKIANLIKEYSLTEKENVIAKKLSGGQMRRVSIALSQLTDPKILFLDEPTLGLDVKARNILWQSIRKMKGKMTIILTTHYLDEVENLADRVGIISRGEIKIVGTIEEIKEKSNSKTLEEAFLKLTGDEE